MRSRRDGGLSAHAKKQTLFSFIPKNGQEWSSDSSDSDYEPGDSSDHENSTRPTAKKAKKRWKSRSPSGGKRTNSRVVKKVEDLEEWQEPCKNGHELWAERLPAEILVMIFGRVVKEDGAIPFLCRASRVCRSWRLAARDSALWQDVDLANGRIKQVPRTLRWLVDHRLTRVTILNLAWWKNLKVEDFKFLFDSCQQLQTVNMSHCKLTPATIKCLGTLPALRNLNLGSATDQIMHPSVMSPLLVNVGHRLNELHLTGNNIKGFNAILNALMENCPNVTLLDFSTCQYSAAQTYLNVERLQHGCPRLRVLRLQNTKLSACQATRDAVINSPGFPALEELSVAITDRRLFIGYGIASVFTYDDDFITRVLKSSPLLRDLDVNMCIDVSESSLLFIPAQNLRHLRIAKCSSGRQYTGLPAIVDKWKHSLETLDISWNHYAHGTLDQALRRLSQGCKAHSISLAGTTASADAIRSLLEGCGNLSLLDLTSCRGLPRGVKRRYQGREQLDKLKQTLARNAVV